MALELRSPTIGAHRRIDLSLGTNQAEWDLAIENIANIIGVTCKKSSRWKSESINVIRIVTLNAAQANMEWSTLWISYSRRNDNLHGKLPRKTFLNTIDGMAEAGLLETRKGFYDRTGAGESRSPKFRATNTLLSILRASSVDFWSIFRAVECPVVLRNEQKKQIRFRNTSRVQIMRKNIDRMNGMLENGKLRLMLLKGMPVPTIEIGWNRGKEAPRSNYRCVPCSLAAKRLYRVFNQGSFKCGGRFFGHWAQRIPKIYRSCIHMCGELVQELDFKGMHLGMLYDMEKLPVPETDVYELPGYEKKRSLCKQVLNAAINASDERSAVKGAVWSARKEYMETSQKEVEDILASLKAKHSPISKYFHSGIGTHLMLRESEIAEKIVLMLAEEKIPCLPIHDSFIVPLSKEVDLEYVMKIVYRNEFKREPDIEVKDE